MLADYPGIVTVKQIQKTLGCSRTFVYELIDDGEIPALQIGTGYKISKICVVQYLLTREKDSELNPDTGTWRKRNSTFEEKREKTREIF